LEENKQKMSLAKIVAVLGWINVFAWLWASILIPVVREEGTIWTLVLFVVLALVASLMNRDN
jgi:hypothetical protein